PDWKDDFLQALAEGMHIRLAAAYARIHVSTVYQRKQRNPEFANEWQEVLKLGTKEQEAEAVRRAYHGTERLRIKTRQEWAHWNSMQVRRVLARLPTDPAPAA